MADMKKVYEDLMIINLYHDTFSVQSDLWRNSFYYKRTIL